MSVSSEVLNAEYSSICQQLGDAYLKHKQLTSLISDLERKALELNNSFNISAKIEKLAVSRTVESSKISTEKSIMQKAEEIRRQTALENAASKAASTINESLSRL